VTEQDATGSVRVLVADAQAIYRMWLRKLLGVEAGMSVTAQADSIAALRAELGRADANVLLLDAAMLTDVAAEMGEIHKLAPEMHVVALVAQMEEETAVELYRRGARGVVPRGIAPELLLKCVRKVAAGETWIDNRSVSRVIEAYRTGGAAGKDAPAAPKLTSKEVNIAGCIARGMRNREIAQRIGTTEQVVKNSLRKIYGKLGVNDRLELALYCLQNKLAEQEALAEAVVAAER